MLKRISGYFYLDTIIRLLNIKITIFSRSNNISIQSFGKDYFTYESFIFSKNSHLHKHHMYYNQSNRIKNRVK